MLPQDRRGASRGNILVERAGHNSGLSLSRHGEDEFRNAQNGGDGYGQCPIRNLVEPLKPTFIHLLLAAFLVQTHQLHIERIGEIRLSGIVKSQMAIFADAEKTEQRRIRSQRLRIFAGGPLRLDSVPRQPVKFAERNLRR